MPVGAPVGLGVALTETQPARTSAIAAAEPVLMICIGGLTCGTMPL